MTDKQTDMNFGIYLPCISVAVHQRMVRELTK